MAQRRGHLGACDICEEQGRVWRLRERVVATVESIEILAFEQICMGCIVTLYECALDESETGG